MRRTHIIIIATGIIVAAGITAVIVLLHQTNHAVTPKDIQIVQAVKEAPGIIITVNETLFMLGYKADPDMQEQVGKAEGAVPSAKINELVKGILPENTQVDEVNFVVDSSTFSLNYWTGDYRVFLQIYLLDNSIHKTVIAYTKSGLAKVEYDNNNNETYRETRIN